MPPNSALSVLGIPLLVLAVSYALLVREFGTRALWRVPIHESGRRTLGETILYYDHFLRELPIDTLFGAAIVESYAVAGLTLEPARNPAAIPLLLFVFLAGVLIGSVRSVGTRVALGDLLQLHETDVRHGWGSHWQMHFMSTAAILLLLLLPVASLGAKGEFAARGGPLILAFLLASALFGTGPKAVSNVRWILHGAREATTYAIMVAVPFFVPLVGTLLQRGLPITPPAIGILACLAAMAIYFVVVYVRNDLDAEASSPRGVAFLLSSHFFEHVLDYVYIMLVVVACLAWTSR